MYYSSMAFCRQAQAISVVLNFGLMIIIGPDPPIHHHTSRAPRAHASRACGAQESGIRQIQTGGTIQVRI